MTAWDRSVTATVKRYKGRGYAYEVVNEPGFDRWNPDVYTAFFRRTARLVKSGEPTAKVIHGSVNGGPDGISRAFFARGGAKLCDVFCFHSYTTGPYTGEDGIRQMRSALKAAGNPACEVWMNEGWYHPASSEDYPRGAIVGSHTGASDADMVTRCVAETCAARMDKCILFNMGYDTHGRSWWDWGGDGTSLYDDRDQPTTLVPAFNVLAHHLGLSKAVRSIRPDGAVLHVFHDRRNNRGVAVVWSEKPGLVLPLAGLEVTDVMGNPLAVMVNQDSTVVTAAANRPVYVTAAGLSGEQLAAKLATLEPKGVSLADRTFSPPKAWANADEPANPLAVEGKPLWELGRVWPAEPDKAESYAPFPAWNPTDAKWLDPKIAQGGNPAGTVSADGRVRIAAMGPRGGGAKSSYLAFVAPADGVYRVAGRVNTSRWDGGGDLKLDVLRLDRAAGQPDVLAALTLRNKEAVPLAVDRVRLRAGQSLVFRFAAPNANAQAGLTFESLTVSRE